MGLDSPVLSSWAARMEREATGLNFEDAEDRAAFRQRVQMAAANLKRDFAIDLGAHWGQVVPGNASHNTAVRAMADAWINRH